MYPPSEATVTAYDYDLGLGTVETVDGRRFDFHCTAITDGTRRVEPGRRVAIAVGAAGPGRWEAVSVHPIGDA